MRAGRLDRRIIVQRNAPTQSSSGAPRDNWTDIGIVWGSVRFERGDERFSAQQVVGHGLCTFTIRYSRLMATLNVKDRLIFDGRFYDIRDVRELGRREGIEIDAQARSEVNLVSGTDSMPTMNTP